MRKFFLFLFPLILNAQPIIIEIEGPSAGRVTVNVEAEDWFKKKVKKMVGYFGEVSFDEAGIPVSVKVKKGVWEVVVYRDLYTFKGDASVIAKKVADIIAEKILSRKHTFASMIAYTQGKAGKCELYIVEVDGTHPVKISRGCRLSFSPSWSPDGRGLAFVCYMRKRPDIFFVDLPTGIMKPFITTDRFEATPEFSPDGAFLVYSSSRDGNIDLFKYNLNSKSYERLTADDFIDVSPSISPDGKMLAYTSNQGGSPGIFIMNLDNGKIKRLTSSSIYATAPEFSPDGTMIIYTVLKDGRTYLEVYEFRRGITYRISPEDMDCEGGSFSPSGELLVTSCKKKTSKYDIYVVDLKTGKVTPLFENMDEDRRFPAWSPYLW